MISNCTGMLRVSCSERPWEFNIHTSTAWGKFATLGLLLRLICVVKIRHSQGDETRIQCQYSPVEEFRHLIDYQSEYAVKCGRIGLLQFVKVNWGPWTVLKWPPLILALTAPARTDGDAGVLTWLLVCIGTASRDWPLDSGEGNPACGTICSGLLVGGSNLFL